jgi:hypothetical protein
VVRTYVFLRAHAGFVPPGSVTGNASLEHRSSARLAATADFEASWRKWLAWAKLSGTA